MLFGLEAGADNQPAGAKFEESKDVGDGNADQLMDMLGVVLEDDGKKDVQPAIVDDAIVIEDDAIVVEGNDGKDSKPKGNKVLTEDDLAILNADKQSRPLWMEGERTKYTAGEILSAFVEEKEINFDLFDKDYLSVIEVFSPNH